MQGHPAKALRQAEQHGGAARAPRVDEEHPGHARGQKGRHGECHGRVQSARRVPLQPQQRGLRHEVGPAVVAVEDRQHDPAGGGAARGGGGEAEEAADAGHGQPERQDGHADHECGGLVGPLQLGEGARGGERLQAAE